MTDWTVLKCMPNIISTKNIIETYISSSFVIQLSIHWMITSCFHFSMIIKITKIQSFIQLYNTVNKQSKFKSFI